MMIQTSVIQIYGSAGCHTVICHTHLCMTETRCPFIDTHSMFYQSMVKGTCDIVDHLFIRNTRCDDPHIYPTLGSQTQRMAHFICDDQVRCHKPAVFFRFIHHTDIHLFAYLFMVHRTVRIRLDKACLLCLIICLNQKSGKITVIFILITDSIPHLQKCYCQGTYCLPLQTDTCILPLSIRMCEIKIFVGKVVTAGKSHFSIDHCDLAVIPVIQEHIQTRSKRVEHSAMDSHIFHFLNEVCIDKPNGTHVVIKYSDFYACLYAVFQNSLDFMPGLCILNGMIFHKNEFLCLCQICQLSLQPFDCLIIINNICILIDRIGGIFLYIIRNIACLRNFPAKHFPALTVIGKQRQKFPVDLVITLPHFTGTAIETNQ